MAEPNIKRQPAPPQIPAYVRNLNALAERAGMDVSMYVEPYSNDPELRLWSEWRGSKEQLRATGLLSPYQSDRLNCTRAKEYNLNIGSTSVWWSWFQILSGTLTTDGDRVCYEIDSAPADYHLEQREGVEILHADELTIYHGSLGALLALGIERKRLPGPTGHGGRWGFNHTPCYAARRQPDGSIVYRAETQQSADRRKREYDEYCGRLRSPSVELPAPRPRPVLRLVVDNTRGPQP